MAYEQPRIHPRKINAQNSMEFCGTNLRRTTRSRDSQKQKKRTCRNVDLAVPTNHRLKLKEKRKER